MTREEAWIRTKGYLYDGLDWIKADEIIKALEQEPCDDVISRQTVLDMMQLKMSDKELYKAVYDLPSVTPKPKTGHWIYDKKSDLSKCSICGAYCPHDELGRIETYYCSYCGAKMQEVKE